ncbi:hypothetical protein GQ600_5833 [Phytophthora cactorum]|nr:hypothetical protein GQ600_5833 [Phytophthora cactorum]
MERMHKTVVALEMKRSSSYSTSRSNRHAAVPATRIAHLMLDDYVRLALRSRRPGGRTLRWPRNWRGTIPTEQL